MSSSVIEQADLQSLFDELVRLGYRIAGPALREGAIVYDEIRRVEDLPAGWTDSQDGGSYRLKRRDDNALFGYAVGPHSWKKFLHPPVVRLWSAVRKEKGFDVIDEELPHTRWAFIGVRSCDLHAIATQDRIFLGSPYTDPIYKANRENIFVVAVNCGHAGGTCFCVSMNTGPKATFGFDLALTEILEGTRHYFVVDSGTPEGNGVLDRIPHRAATNDDIGLSEHVIERTRQQMGRQMDTSGIKELLYQNYEHPRWNNVAARCLACANCTMVCPTCFCTTVEDVSDLSGDHAERWRKWDSCFTMDFSYVHGGSVRPSIKGRYRQWMIHKLATWIDQFGTSGCVGCGRCITWCPVGIDLTEEVRAIRETPQ